MDTDDDTGDALVDMDSLSSLLEEEIDRRDRVTYIYGRNYYFGRAAVEKRNENLCSRK